MIALLRAVALIAAVALVAGCWRPEPRDEARPPASPSPTAPVPSNELLDRAILGDDSGKMFSFAFIPLKVDGTDLDAVRRANAGLGRRVRAQLSDKLAGAAGEARLTLLVQLAAMHNLDGEFAESLRVLSGARAMVESGPLARHRPDVVFMQAVTALRSGETDNCVNRHCKASCILPLDASAVHAAPEGSRTAVRHLTDFLAMRPGDPVATWLLNVAYMTLGAYPAKVPPQHRVPESVFRSEVDIGKFVDVAEQAGVNRGDCAGGAIMDDFDGDGLLDIFQTSYDQSVAPVLYRNRGDGTFMPATGIGLDAQYGGLTIHQTDYDNDGALDVWVSRSGWEPLAVRHSLLRNNLDGTFTDVTFPARLKFPMASQASAWGDFDNDGWVDVFCGAEGDRNRLYRNKGDGTFEELAIPLGVAGSHGEAVKCKGAVWGDYDRDGWLDLLVSNRPAAPQLFRNEGGKRFIDVAPRLGITRPRNGFPCWFWDQDNDGWLDVFISEFDTVAPEVAKAEMRQPHRLDTGHLYRNIEGRAFEDVTRASGLDAVILAMGSNHVDVDNDGLLDCYFGTGAPPYSLLLPNRMFKNLDGKRFADVSYSSGTAHLQKGHQVACGDYDRDGDADIFEQMGGAAFGDGFADVLFQNPGHGNGAVTVQLVGTRGNRAAIGARVVAFTDETPERMIPRDVSSGGSFGANAFEVMIGIGKARGVKRVEVTWAGKQAVQVVGEVRVGKTVRVVEPVNR